MLVDQRPFLVFEVPRHKGSSPSDRHHKTRKCQGPYPGHWHFLSPLENPALIFGGCGRFLPFWRILVEF